VIANSKKNKNIYMLLTGVYIGTTKWKMIWHYLISTSGFPGGSVVKNPLMQETQVQSPGWEDPLEKGMASHSSVFAWEIPCPFFSWIIFLIDWQVFLMYFGYVICHLCTLQLVLSWVLSPFFTFLLMFSDKKSFF